MECRLCPRRCPADRKNGERGFCGMTEEVFVARAAPHFWEEPCISGTNGSGTVFFSGCNLRCVYCQNYKIAAGKAGKPMSLKELSETFLSLQEAGCHNINLVTPSHYAPQIAKALRLAQLKVPVVYNTSSYECVETLKLLDGLVDIYLADFKYLDSGLAKKYSHAPDYPQTAKAALQEMVRQTGGAEYLSGTSVIRNATEYPDGALMKRGVIVRHLLLPGQTAEAKRVLRYLYETYGDMIAISILNQYTPLPHVAAYPELSRHIMDAEYEEAVDFAAELGIGHGFLQEGETASESFIPEFAEK
ncbi:MAG: radical SAM protein [Lachnospiraceae bacterium]|nr:radical SAM protein [Lachnospiraceae bacterium]